MADPARSYGIDPVDLKNVGKHACMHTKIRYWKFCCALHVISSPIITALFLSAAVIGIQQLNHRRQIHELSPKSLFFRGRAKSWKVAYFIHKIPMEIYGSFMEIYGTLPCSSHCDYFQGVFQICP